MKKILIATCLLCMTAVLSHAQIRVFNNANNQAVTNSPAFVDASSNPTANGNASWGKGLVFPRVDLSTFTVPAISAGYGRTTSFPTYLDGMIVYNTKSGGTAAVGITDGTLSPGFWYYDNKTTSETGGTWKLLGGGSSGSGAYLENAGNGLSASNGTVTLGGTLTTATEIKQADFNFYTTGDGKVSIGAAPTANSAKFEVKGSATNSSAYDAGSSRDIDFGNSNLAYTTASAGAFVLTNVKDGGTYTLAVQGTASGTSTFTANNTAAQPLTVKVLNNRATAAGTQTLYTIIVMGSTAYVFVATGF